MAFRGQLNDVESMDSIRRLLSHPSSSPRPRLQRVNALRNSPRPPIAEDESDDGVDPFRIDGGENTEENVEQILLKLNLSRLDMLGIPAAEWESVMNVERQSSVHQQQSILAEPRRSHSIDNSELSSTTGVDSGEDQQELQPRPEPSTAESSYVTVPNIVEEIEITSVAENATIERTVDGRLPVEVSTSSQTSEASYDSMQSSTLSTISSLDEPIWSNVPWDSWQKLEKLGQGSFGEVYKGVSCFGEFFAVKEISLGPLASVEAANQLQQEIVLLQGCQHESIVQYLGTERTQRELYIFLELATEGSVVSLYKRYRLFDQQIRSYTRQILQGLKYLHDMNVVHRDIKCANILVQPNGKVKLADFGMAKKLELLDTMKSAKGSAYWMAPEVIDPKRNAGIPSDIWSLGCTVFEMACGHPPFDGLPWITVMWKVGHGAIPEIPDHLHPEAQDFIRQCLQVDPAERPTAEMLLEHPFVAPVPPRTPSSSSPPTRTSSAELIPPTRIRSEELLPATPSGSPNAETPGSSVGSRIGRSVRTRFPRAVGD